MTAREVPVLRGRPYAFGPRARKTCSVRSTSGKAYEPMSRVSLVTVVCCAAILSACKKDGASTASPGAGAIPPTVVPAAIYAADSGAGKVEEECDLQNKLPEYFYEYAPSAVPGSGGSARVLQMEVVNVIGQGGGMYTGPKQLTVQGTLTEGGQVLGSFQARRTTTGGAFGGYKGTCSLMQRNAKAVARDISEWVASPTMDARLGEL